MSKNLAEKFSPSSGIIILVEPEGVEISLDRDLSVSGIKNTIAKYLRDKGLDYKFTKTYSDLNWEQIPENTLIDYEKPRYSEYRIMHFAEKGLLSGLVESVFTKKFAFVANEKEVGRLQEHLNKEISK